LPSGASEPPPEDQEAESSEVDHQQEVVTTTGDAMMHRISVAVIPLQEFRTIAISALKNQKSV
jgi:hypothetical protein